jgi:hypothetical protein
MRGGFSFLKKPDPRPAQRKKKKKEEEEEEKKREENLISPSLSFCPHSVLTVPHCAARPHPHSP